MKYTLKNEHEVFNDHYQMLKAKVSYDTFSGDAITTDRLAFHRGDSVAILLYEKDTKSLLLTKQFRYPTTKHNIGWMLEIPAGSIEKEENPKHCVIRETFKEVGYKISKPRQIANFYPSPGACTERCYLFFDVVTKKDKVTNGGGVADEHEDIQLIKLPVLEVKQYLKNNIIDAKTIIALQWFLYQSNYVK